MKNFVHTYKGFTGGLSDVYIHDSGKLLATACLDRYVRIHHADTCVLMYQCYVKSKATRILLRDSLEDPNKSEQDKEVDEEEDDQTNKKQNNNKKSKDEVSEDEEYDDMFENMQTIW